MTTLPRRPGREEKPLYEALIDAQKLVSDYKSRLTKINGLSAV